MTESAKANHVLGQPLELPCGVIFKNRLIKSAMSDSLGNGMGDPTEAQIRLYERWAEGGVALSLIGEVQADYRYPEKPGNLVLDSTSNQNALNALARRVRFRGRICGHNLAMPVRFLICQLVVQRARPH